MEYFLKLLGDFLLFFRGWGDIVPRPAYDVHPRELAMNQEPVVPAQPDISAMDDESRFGYQSPTDTVLIVAKNALGKDMTPGDEVPDDVACVAQLVAVLEGTEWALPKTLTFTPYLFNILRSDKRWRATLTPKAGCVIVSPTVGTLIGHCGILLSNTRIASNWSYGANKGKWDDNYSIQNWATEFKTKMGLHIYIFEPVDN